MSEWLALAERVASCRSCTELAAARSNVVVGDYPPGARVVANGAPMHALREDLGLARELAGGLPG